MENFTFIQEAVGPSMFHTADGSEAMPPDEYDYVDDVLLRSVDMSLYGGLDERGMPLVWNARDPRLTRNLRVVTPVRFQVGAWGIAGVLHVVLACATWPRVCTPVHILLQQSSGRCTRRGQRR